jgi:hypothetical protein
MSLIQITAGDILFYPGGAQDVMFEAIDPGSSPG